MKKPQHLNRAHRDENAVVLKFIKQGYPALRIPTSGASKYFPGDILAFTFHTVKLILVRRTESGDKVVFKKDEINDIKGLAGRIAPLVYPNSVQVELVAHIVKRRKWVEKMLLDWNGKDVVIKCEDEHLASSNL